jgi:NADH dehydrogenase [ubiquinone] 1 alpha subcomplex assembly factor 5
MSDVPKLFDMRLRRLRQKRAQHLSPQPNFLQQMMLENIADRVGFVARRFQQALLLGDVAAQDWPELATMQQVAAVDDSDRIMAAEKETDLVVCAGLLHAANDVPGLLAQMRSRLQPDGFMVASFLGGDTLQELRDCLLQAEADITGGAAQRVHPMIGVRDGGALLQRAGFSMPVADADILTVTYAHPLNLLQDLRTLGETSVLADKPGRFLQRDVLARFVDLYGQKYPESNGRVRATFSVMTLSGWSPAANQPRPKQRGSATVSLAAALPIKSG